jgi:F0F1-type ATP synthase delta subunit
MDVSVEEFLQLHAESRRVKNIPEIVQKILKEVNKLAGESFTLDTPITALS